MYETKYATRKILAKWDWRKQKLKIKPKNKNKITNRPNTAKWTIAFHTTNNAAPIIESENIWEIIVYSYIVS